MASKSNSILSREEDMKAVEFLEEMTRNADAVQNNVLQQILTQNAHTEYLNGFNLAGATDRNTFKSKIPVTTYEDILPLIRRIADGDTSPILCAHPVSELICSSGTSGSEPKLIPCTKQDMDRNILFASLVNPVMQLHIDGLDKGKGLYFWFTKSDTKTKGGIPVRTATTSLYKSDLFKTRPYNPYFVFTSPIEAICCADTFQSMYAQLLCGLYERQEINRIGAVFASGLLRVIAFLELNWQRLARDIRTGSLNPKLTDEPLRKCMTMIVRPDPELADFLVREFSKDSMEGIITRIWPNARYLEVIVTGTMSQYIQTLDYYSGGLPKVSTFYASSESYFGINLNPMCEPSEISYTLLPNMAYFEFLPHKSDPTDLELTHTELVDLVDVEIGKQYELVITTYSGLCRYRVYDILQVVGFYNSAPQFRFIRRKNVLLNIDGEKTTEIDLQAAVASVSQILQEFKTSVVEYTSYADTTTIPGHYVIYYELLGKDSDKSLPSDEVLDRCCLAMEESLNPIYRLLRMGESIGPLEIRVVKSGTFDELRDGRGASINQYKVPRCVTSKPIVDLLDSRVVSKHFNPK